MLEPYYSKYKLHEYDELKMEYISLVTKQKAMDTPTINVDTWWNLMHDILEL
jgi:hypothetical protein